MRKTRQFSCVNAIGIPPAVKQVWQPTPVLAGGGEWLNKPETGVASTWDWCTSWPGLDVAAIGKDIEPVEVLWGGADTDLFKYLPHPLDAGGNNFTLIPATFWGPLMYSYCSVFSIRLNPLEGPGTT